VERITESTANPPSATVSVARRASDQAPPVVRTASVSSRTTVVSSRRSIRALTPTRAPLGDSPSAAART